MSESFILICPVETTMEALLQDGVKTARHVSTPHPQDKMRRHFDNKHFLVTIEDPEVMCMLETKGFLLLVIEAN